MTALFIRPELTAFLVLLLLVFMTYSVWEVGYAVYSTFEYLGEFDLSTLGNV
jgi:hypothetical protein